MFVYRYLKFSQLLETHYTVSKAPPSFSPRGIPREHIGNTICKPPVLLCKPPVRLWKYPMCTLMETHTYTYGNSHIHLWKLTRTLMEIPRTLMVIPHEYAYGNSYVHLWQSVEYPHGYPMCTLMRPHVYPHGYPLSTPCVPSWVY